MSSGWSATKMMLSMRWRMIRQKRTRMIILFSGLFILVGVSSSINIGYAIELSIRESVSTGVFQYQDVILQVLKGALGNIGSLFFLSVFAMAIFAPLAGTATISLVPAEDLQSIRPSNTHRYFDSIIINSISGIGILQLLTLTCLASILSINSLRIFSMLFMWSLWILLIELTTTVGWILEWAIRRFGKVKRRIFSGLIFAVTFGVIAFALYSGVSPYGFGNFLISRLVETTHSFNTATVVNILSVWVIIIIFLFLGSSLAKRALLYSPPANAKGSYHKPQKETTNVSKIALRVIWAAVWRTGEVKKPILALVLFGIPAMIASQLDINKTLGLTIAIPLTVALSWSVNLFGILGTGMNWVGSQPKIMKRLPLIAFFIQIVINFTLIGILWFVSFAAGNSSISGGLFLLKNASFVIFGTSAFSTYLSINYPIRAQIIGRGNAIIPPLTALGYLFQLLIVAGVPAFLLSISYSNVLRYAALGVIVLLELLMLLLQNRKWGDAQIRSRIIQIVSAQ